MTTTPTVWKEAFTANAGAAAGNQERPYTIGLADDRFLTVWNDDTSGSSAGTDIFAQIFDAQGNPAGAAFQINSKFYFGDDEVLGSIAALPDGGFVIAFIDYNGAAEDAIRIQRYDAAGNSGIIGSIAGGGNPVSDPEITVAADGSYMVSFTRNIAGDLDVRGVIVSAGNVIGPEFDAGENSGDSDLNPDVAALTNGSFVSAFEEFDSGVVSIEARIVNSAGASIRLVDVAFGGLKDPHVAALTDGGFVVAYSTAYSNADVLFSIFDNAGNVVSNRVVAAGGANSQSEPKVVGLKGGGFFVVWSDSTAGYLFGQRYGASGPTPGVAIGTTIAIAPNAFQPELGLTDDGRILVAFHYYSGEIGEVILDPRDNSIGGDNTDETITSRLDGATINGFGGADTLLGQGAADTLIGGGGEDVLKGGGGNDILRGGDHIDTVDGGAGNDTIQVLQGEFGDNVDGGSGIDTLDLSGLTTNTATVDLAAGIWSTSGGAGTTTIVNVENVNGGAGNDELRGSSGNNVFVGLGGADKLYGGGGSDAASYIYASAGVTVSLANPAINTGEAAGDTYVSIERLIGSNFDDNLNGANVANNTLRGGAGNDTLKGYTGNDNLEGGTGNDTFVFNTALNATSNVDTILDFGNETGNNDRFLVDDAFFVGVEGDPAGNGELMSGQFKNTSQGAIDADDHIIYVQSSGNLYYDSNGSGPGGRILFAKVAAGTVLTHQDFFVN